MASVLVIREFDNFSRILADLGHDVANCPAIRTAETDGAARLAEMVIDGNYDGHFITSRRAAEIFRREVVGRGIEVVEPIYVLGRSSFEILADKGLALSFEEAAGTAREMIAAIPEAKLANRRFLFIRGDKSLGVVRREVGRVAVVDEIVVYATEDVAIDAGVAENDYDAICFFSPSAVASVVRQAGAEFLKRARVAAIGMTTAAALLEAGIEPQFVPPRPTAEEFAAGVADMLGAK